ncbi:MAG: helix-turn-helix transcriptional regulator [Subdoligranulum sp.]|nr:helix-turn-helix transcriptional regulator [Subdoligranulum sp.]
MTQEQVAQDMNVRRTTVAMWESGKSKPRAELLPKLARLFKCSIEELLEDGGETA